MPKTKVTAEGVLEPKVKRPRKSASIIIDEVITKLSLAEKVELVKVLKSKIGAELFEKEAAAKEAAELAKGV